MCFKNQDIGKFFSMTAILETIMLDIDRDSHSHILVNAIKTMISESSLDTTPLPRRSGNETILVTLVFKKWSKTDFTMPMCCLSLSVYVIFANAILNKIEPSKLIIITARNSCPRICRKKSQLPNLFPEIGFITNLMIMLCLHQHDDTADNRS